MNAKKQIALILVLVIGLSGCSRGGGGVNLETAKTDLIKSADLQCEKAAQKLTNDFRNSEPANVTEPYVQFATAVGVRKTLFQRLLKENEAFKNELEPISADYENVDTIANSQMLPSANQGDTESLQASTNQAAVAAQRAVTLSSSFGFEACSKPIPVPVPQIPVEEAPTTEPPPQ